MKAQLIVIETPRDYEAARALVSELMNAATSEDGARLRAQAAIVAAYEARIRPPRPVDPIEAIKFRMDQMGMKRADLVKIIGSKSKVSEILNRKRPLSLAMIRRLHKELKIPADVLIKAA
jgi:HTH-type transcriptional regulator/antitoxin HigA